MVSMLRHNALLIRRSAVELKPGLTSCFSIKPEDFAAGRAGKGTGTGTGKEKSFKMFRD